MYNTHIFHFVNHQHLIVHAECRMNKQRMTTIITVATQSSQATAGGTRPILAAAVGPAELGSPKSPTPTSSSSQEAARSPPSLARPGVSRIIEVPVLEAVPRAAVVDPRLGALATAGVPIPPWGFFDWAADASDAMDRFAAAERAAALERAAAAWRPALPSAASVEEEEEED